MVAAGTLACATLASLSDYTAGGASDASEASAALDASEASAADAGPNDAGCTAPRLGLLAHFTMDTDSVTGNGLFLTDSSGNGHAGTLVSFPNPPVTVPGRLGQALQFPSASAAAVVDVPGLPLDDASRGVTTVSLWFLSPGPPDASVNQVLAFLPPAQDNLWLTGNGPSAVNLCFDTKANDCFGLGGASVLGTWVHAVAMFTNGALSISQLFVNGQLVGSTCLSAGGCTSTVSAASSVDLGGFTQFGYDGLLDEVRIYDRALTATEVTSLYDLCP